MRRIIFMLFLTVCFWGGAAVGAHAANTDPTPLTIGDLEQLKTMNGKEQRAFVFDYYRKNKERGATDGQILRELLKLDVKDGENSDLVKKLDALGKRYRDIEQFVKNAIEEANVKLLEDNPGRTDLIIDPDNLETWKNIQYIRIGKSRIEDYLRLFKNKGHYSDAVSTQGMTALLASCANKADGDSFLMSFVLLPEDGYKIAMQTEGAAPEPVKADFTNSTNVQADPFEFPVETSWQSGDTRVFGYDGNVYLPFTVRPSDPAAAARVRAVLTANLCQNDVCRPVSLPEIDYTAEKAELETSVCSRLQQAVNVTPAAQKLKVKLQKAYFKKDKSGEIDLFIRLKIPSFGVGDNQTVVLKNAQGLRMSDPFVTRESGKLFLKFRVLNPQVFKGGADFVLDVAYPARAAELNVRADLETSAGLFFSNFSFSPVAFTAAFFHGIKFLVFSPMFAAFLLLFYQAACAVGKSPEKTVSFYNGLGKMFYFWCVVYAVGAVGWKCVFPDGGVYWGLQFLLPPVNFCLAVLFLLCAVYEKRLFDNVAVAGLTDRFALFFSMFRPADVRESAGLAAGFVAGALLAVTPLTGMYYDTALLLSKSPVLYSLSFAAGAGVPFLVLSLYDKRAAALEMNAKARRLFSVILPVPLCVSAAAALVLIWMETGLAVFAMAVALIGAAVVLFQVYPHKKKAVAAVLLLIAVILIPPLPNTKSLNAQGGVDFNEELLRDTVRQGKSVYLNVTENFCLSCQWNRLMMMRQGAPDEIANKDVLVMRIRYNHPFLRRLFTQGGDYTLPMNFMFTPLYPEGKAVRRFLTPWTADEIIEETVRGASSDRQSAPEQSRPDPAAPSTN